MATKRSVLQLDKFSTEDWLTEGPVELSVSPEGALVLDSLTGGSTSWYKPQAFHGDLFISWTAMALHPVGKNNLNFIFHAMENDGSDVVERSAERTGAYKEYHQFPNYIVTFVGPEPGKGYTRFRRNPGFRLLSEYPDKKAEVNQQYDFIVELKGERIRVWIDGDLVHDLRDVQPLREGRIGIRTWQTKLQISRLAVETR